MKKRSLLTAAIILAVCTFNCFGTCPLTWISAYNLALPIAIGDLVVITETDSSTEVEEFGRSDTFTISLLSAPSLDVTITISPDSDDLMINGGFAGDDAALEFDWQSWNAPQTVTLVAGLDGLEEATETVTLTFTVESLDANYDNVTISPLTVTVFDEAVKVCPKGDIDDDCLVSLTDLLIMADQWLDADGCSGVNCADLIGLEVIDLDDFQALSKSWEQAVGPVVINEFMADNNSDFPDISPETWEVFDETGEAVDWIELKNMSDSTVSLNGWYLTDDAGEPNKWAFPATTEIAANGFLLIYASGNDLVAGNYIHTNFSLDSDGEYLALIRPDGRIAWGYDEYEYAAGKFGFPSQVSNVAYGLSDYLQNQQYYHPPTPGSENINSALGISPDTTFSVDRGFYSAPFDVTISTENSDAVIRYTTDGSTPDWTNGQTVNAGQSILITGTTILRACSFLPGHLPSNVDTQTYIFVNDVTAQQPGGEKPGPDWPEAGTSTNGQKMNYGMDPDIVNSAEYSDLIDDALLAIPTLSMVTDLGNLFDAESGIYVNAADARGESDFWTLQKEKACSLELLNPDQSDGFNINCGVRIRGGYSRTDNNPKHAFRFFFRSKYGKSKLDYPLFGDEGASEFDKVDLRTSQNYSWSFNSTSTNFHNTMLRDVFSRDLQGKLKHPHTKSRYYHLYINGVYWGLYQTQERVDSRFAASYMDGSKDDFDAVRADRLLSRQMLPTDGNLEAFTRLWSSISDGVSTAEEYFRLQGMNIDGTNNPAYERLLDVDNLIDFMIINYYTADTDGAGSRFGNVPNNLFSIYNRVNPDGFKWFEHDSEHSMGISGRGWPNYENMVTPFTTAGAQLKYFNPHWMHEQLAVQNAEYRIRFADRVQELFFNDGLFTCDQVWNMLMNRASQIDLAIIAESARWGDSKTHPPRTRQDWYNAQQHLKDFLYGTHSPLGVSQPWAAIPRQLRVLQQFKDSDFFPNVSVPGFLIDGTNQHGGVATADSQLTIVSNSGQNNGTYVDSQLIGETVAVRVHVPTDNSLGTSWTAKNFVEGSTWSDGSTTTGVGYERNSGYESWVNTDIESIIRLISTSVFCRIEFNYDGIDILEKLKLSMRYDDGFIAYLNGMEVCRSSNITNSTPGTAAANNHEASESFEVFDISNKLSSLTVGNNVLAIHGINTSLTSSDMIIQPKLIGQYWQPQPVSNEIWYTTDGTDPRLVGGGINTASAIQYADAVTLTRSTRVKARNLAGGQWSAMCNASYAIGPVAGNLRITEIMYNPSDPNTEFIELQNIGTESINLNLVEFTNGIDFVFGDVVLDAGQYGVVVENQSAFEAKYGMGVNIAGQYEGNLNNGGERIELVDAVEAVIHDFSYKDSWYELTDGRGFSLTSVAGGSFDPNEWNNKSAWGASPVRGGSPGEASEMVFPEDSIVFNELLAHSHDSQDWIELYNTTELDINISGWFLSDDNSDANAISKYEIPDGTVIYAKSYRMFYQDVSFGSTLLPEGKGFGLSEGGETVYMYSGRNGEVTGHYQTKQKFDASKSNVSLGRFEKAELSGGYDFTQLRTKTQGLANTAPLISDIVITEIHYHPSNGEEYEYVELYNRSSVDISLMAEAATEISEGIFVNEYLPWRLKGISFEFPPNTVVKAGEYFIVAKDPTKYEPSLYDIYGPYDGQLDNGGEQIELQIPGDLELGKKRFWIPVEQIDYDDTSPWPANADGGGNSLHRLNFNTYGRDYSNWNAAVPGPGN